MLKIGEFSKLSMLTVKALRFYEKEGLLIPAEVDPWSGYRYYEMEQLETAVRILSASSRSTDSASIWTRSTGIQISGRAILRRC